VEVGLLPLETPVDGDDTASAQVVQGPDSGLLRLIPPTTMMPRLRFQLPVPDSIDRLLAEWRLLEFCYSRKHNGPETWVYLRL